jgi:glycerol-1-phosphate dehydrogenase [NAD(P)+]
MIQDRWPAIRAKLEAQLMTADQLRGLLADAGCPTDQAAIGITMAQLRESYRLARTIRRRYTVLDLVNETGVLDECVAKLFGPGGYWGRYATV